MNLPVRQQRPNSEANGTPTIGRLLRGRYRITNRLGQGGFSLTYLAKDTQLPDEPDCVVKQLLPLRHDGRRSASSHRQILQQAKPLFEAEARILQKLSRHSQIPDLLAYFDEASGQEFFMVQEFIPGKTLQQVLANGHRLRERQTVYLLVSVLTILDHLHRHHVLHLDVKPSNLIYRQTDNEIVLIDFGTVQALDTQMAAALGVEPRTVALGTPGYMACEHSYGRPQPASDLYALGIVAIQALTGKHPQDLREDLQTGDLIWQEGTEVSPALADIIRHMVKYDYNHRFASAQAALQALETLATRCSFDFPALSPSMGSSGHRQFGAASLVTLARRLKASVADWYGGREQPTVRSAQQPTAAGETAVQVRRPAHSATLKPPVDATVPAVKVGDRWQLLPLVEDATTVQPFSLLSDRPGDGSTIPSAGQPHLHSHRDQSPLPSRQSLLGRGLAAGTWQRIDPQGRYWRGAVVFIGGIAIGFSGWVSVNQHMRLHRDRQVLERAIFTAPEDVESAIRMARRIAPGTSVYDNASARIAAWTQQAIEQRQLERDRTVLEQARTVADRSLEQAIAQLDSLPAMSPLQTEAQQLANGWQADLLQRQLAASSSTLARLQLQVTIQGERVTVAYRSDASPKLQTDEGMQRVAVALMGAIRSRYAKFSQLQVYPEGARRQANLDLATWLAYKRGDLSLDGTIRKVSVENKQS
jgi:serine/threonine protein kinase